MKIVFNTMSLANGGAERVITNLCNEYLDDLHDITIITYDCQKPYFKLNKGIKYITLDDSLSQVKQHKAARFIRRRKRLKKELKALSPDVILSFLPEPNFTLLSLRKILNMPLIVSVRSDPNHEYSFLPYKIMMRMLYPKADGYVFQTEQARDYFDFSKNIVSKSTIISNPINTKFIRQPFDGTRDKEIVSAGRLHSAKNHKLLIKAFAKVSDDFTDYTLIIYGEGNMRCELQNLIDELKLSDRITLAGEKQNISELIYKSSLFVLSSDYEGMPNALMEAMSMGLPVISTDCPCGGPKTLIEHGNNGLLVKVGAEEELSDAMRKILSDADYAKKIGNEAGKISTKLAPEKIYQKWDEYIHHVCKTK